MVASLQQESDPHPALQARVLSPVANLNTSMLGNDI